MLLVKCVIVFILPDSLDVQQELKHLPCSEQTQLEHFIPHQQGPGICSLKLINFLVKLQNEMIESSWKKADEYGTR